MHKETDDSTVKSSIISSTKHQKVNWYFTQIFSNKIIKLRRFAPSTYVHKWGFVSHLFESFVKVSLSLWRLKSCVLARKHEVFMLTRRRPSRIPNRTCATYAFNSRQCLHLHTGTCHWLLVGKQEVYHKSDSIKVLTTLPFYFLQFQASVRVSRLIPAH